MANAGEHGNNDASTGASYLEIACVLIDHVANTMNDCGSYVLASFVPCWSSATDDHLRNHSFILVPGKGWHLSDVHDMNPAPGSQGLKDVQNAFTNCSRR
ncbi:MULTISPECIES: HipA domain-containing protein [unclassified Acidovorax]|uniref:HipA domain-containing protein n=1 Tax=unclassified Acidovorax TaxID=2684926 RepID=UPI0021065638|nr:MULTISPECIES: HipA domain-containing protein [unclassified Acidovorax]